MTISSTGLGPNSGNGLAGARNLGAIWYTPTGLPIPPSWQVQPGEFGYAVAGRFPNVPNPFWANSAILGDESIHILRLKRDNASTDPKMILDFSSGFSNLGFHASANQDDPFNLLVQIYNAGGTLLRETSFLGLSGGGLCASLAAPGGIACADAPYIYASGFDYGATRVVISSSNDNFGFQIGGLDVFYNTGGVPEPSAMILSGGGIALLALGRKRWRKKN
jgi:hypothetical protein